MKTPEIEYEPFGPEWEKEMNKLPKTFLIDMLKKRVTPITKDSLLNYGMTLTPDSLISPIRKDLGKLGDAELTLAVTRYRNCDEFALVIHGVGQLYLNITCIEDLQAAEKFISEFDSFT